MLIQMRFFPTGPSRGRIQVSFGLKVFFFELHVALTRQGYGTLTSFQDGENTTTIRRYDQKLALAKRLRQNLDENGDCVESE